MSASLVGSEMCIRDSAGEVNAEAGVEMGDVDIADIADFGTPAGEEPRGPCLLYTSDAADDM
eukprot:14230838-Alexandrium_andersonii.AAC.1